MISIYLILSLLHWYWWQWTESGLITSATHTPRRLRAWDDAESSGAMSWHTWHVWLIISPGAAPSHGPRQAAVASGGLGENMGFQMVKVMDWRSCFFEETSIYLMFDWKFLEKHGKTMFFLQIYPLTTVGQRADVNWGVPQDRYSHWGPSVATKLAPRRVETSWLTTRWGWIWRFTKLHPMDMPWICMDMPWICHGYEDNPRMSKYKMAMTMDVRVDRFEICLNLNYKNYHSSLKSQVEKSFRAEMTSARYGECCGYR